MGKMIKFAHVNEHGDFEKVLSHFDIDYQKSGIQLRLCCPFHDDSNPSLPVVLEDTVDSKGREVKRNTYHCFACSGLAQGSGSLIDFVAYHKEIGLLDAAMLIDEICGCGLAPAKSRRKACSTDTADRGDNEKRKRSERRTERQRPARRNGNDKDAETAEAAPGTAEAAGDAKPVNPPLKFTLTLDHEHPYVLGRLTPGEIAEFGVGVLPETSRSKGFAGR